MPIRYFLNPYGHLDKVHRVITINGLHGAYKSGRMNSSDVRHAIFFVLDHSTNKSVLLWLVIAKIANQIILSVGGGCEGGPIFYSISWGFVPI